MKLTGIVAAGLLTLALTACGDSQPPVGPLGQERGYTSGSALSVQVGDRFTYGGSVLFIELVPDVGGVEVLGIEPIYHGAGLRLLGAKTATVSDGSFGPQVLYHWPPDDTDSVIRYPIDGKRAEVRGVSDVIGARLESAGAGPTYQEFYLGFESIEPGRTTVRGVRVIYQHDGGTYSLVIPHALAVCAGEGAIPVDCDYEETVEIDHRPPLKDRFRP